MFKKILNFLRFKSRKNRLTQYENIQGWLTPNEASGLFEVAAVLPKNSVVLEIGSWKGKSTWCIAQGLKKGIINCIDPFNTAGEEGSKEIYERTKGDKSLIEQFRNNIAGIPAKVKIKTHQGFSSEFTGAVSKIDFLFIDGDHSIDGCKFDFINFHKEIEAGGFIAFHDYDPTRKDLGPTWVIENLILNNKDFEFYNQYDSLWVARKIR